ncbi:MAG: MBL fold metallo-hydrolase [Cyclobacteriaceae bacterium]|nr:MBL fold metallo-hydrolase [Cyclobacteriaceae bacterium]
MNKLVVSVFISALFGCTGSLRHIQSNYATEDFSIPVNTNTSNNLKIHYSGCGGLIINKGETTLMTDPYFSNKGVIEVISKTIGGGVIKPSESDINYGLDRSTIDITNTNAIFVSHAHYDHLLDVPWLLKNKINTSTQIYGSHTTQFILEKFEIESKNIVDVEPSMATNSSSGKWLDVAPNIRVLPIKSHHAPHMGNIKLYSGEHKSKFKRKKEWKSKLNHWKEGQTLSYLFEFRDEEKTFNLFVQTSASEKPLGLPPQSVLSSHPIDLAVLCVASYKNVEDYPHNHLLNLKPKAVVFVHWEDFFRGYQKSPRTVRASNVKKFINQVTHYYDSSKFWLPKPGVTISVKY